MHGLASPLPFQIFLVTMTIPDILYTNQILNVLTTLPMPFYPNTPYPVTTMSVVGQLKYFLLPWVDRIPFKKLVWHYLVTASLTILESRLFLLHCIHSAQQKNDRRILVTTENTWTIQTGQLRAYHNYLGKNKGVAALEQYINVGEHLNKFLIIKI